MRLTSMADQLGVVAGAVQNVTAVLKRGNMVVADLSYRSPKGSGTITGGTGRYQDASGFDTSQRLTDGGVQLTFRFN